MSTTPGDPRKPEEGTVVIPAGQSGRPSGEEPATPRDIWDEEATRVVDPPPPSEPPQKATQDIWSAGRADLPPGTILGNYNVGKIIARGGLGAIYDGVNIHNPAERVAIKTILPEPGLSERFGRMLLDEANALMRVRHDAVVPYRTYGRIAGTDEFYLVLEFIEGDTLNEFYRRRKLTEPELFSLARRLAAGLQASHDEGLVHRDVSPDNVLLQDGHLDKATLIDFGIAKIGGSEDQPDTQFAGKLSYAAPEQFVPGGRIGPWTDVYSLALLLIAAARARALPMGKTVEAAQAARQAVPEIEGVPPRLLAPLRRMLEPHPSDRPQSMVEVIGLLDAAQNGPVPAATASPGAPAAPESAGDPAPARRTGIRRSERPARQPAEGRRRRSGWMSAILALLIGGGVAGALMLYEEQIFGKPKPGATGAGPAPSSRPAAAVPLPVPTPPVTAPADTKPRAAQLADLVAAFTSRLSTVPCTVTRVSGGDTGRAFTVRVHGVWSDAAAVGSAVNAVSADTGVTPVLSGETVDPSLCPVVQAMKPLAARLAVPAMTRPKPTGESDRSVSSEITTDPDYPVIVLLEASAEGRLIQILDVGAAIASGGIVVSDDGRADLRLAPRSSDANVGQTLIIAIEAAAPLPGALVTPDGLDAAAWVAALAAAPDATRVTIMPRDGVPAGTAAPLPIIQLLPAGGPPLTIPPTIPLEPDPVTTGADAEMSARIRAIDCSLIRIEAVGGQTKLRGVWGKADDVASVANVLSQERSASILLAGDAISPRRCAMVNAVKPFFIGEEPATLARPQALASGASTLAIRPDPAYPHSYVIWGDSANRVRALIDLSDPADVAAAISAGRLNATGDGGYTLVLPRFSADPAADSGVIMLVMSSQPLPPAALDRTSTQALTAWLALLNTAVQSARLRLDLVEYAQAPPG